MRIRIAGIETAVDIYYSYPELGTKEIMRLFDCSRTTAQKLKNIAREKQKERNILTFSDDCVETQCAYAAWNIDIVNIEKKLLRSRKINKALAT